MSIKSLKKIFQGTSLLLIVLFLIMLVAKTDVKDFALIQGTSMAAVPMSWDLDKLRSNIARQEKRYERYYFENNKDPNSAFMRRQEAGIAAMKHRQNDLEFEQAMGAYPPNPYNPKDYRLSNFKSDGRPTPNVYYEPGAERQNGVENLYDTSNNWGNPDDVNMESSSDQSDLPWGSQTHHQGIPFGGQVIQMLPCDCEGPGTYISYINDTVSKSGIWLKVDSSSKMYEYWHLIPNRYGVGTYDPVATCAMTINQCQPLPVTGKINRGPGAGTSL